MGMGQSVEAQPLDGESELREESGNEAVDADFMWEVVAGWNKMGGELQSSTEVLTDDEVEDVVVGVATDGTTTEAGSNVGSWTFVSQLDSVVSSAETLGTGLGGVASGDLLPPPVVVVVLTSGADSLVSSDVRSTGRSGITDEESPVGKDGESIKETEPIQFPDCAVLPCPKDRRRLSPNPASGVVPDHFTFFRFCGRVIALALMHRVQVDVEFAVTLFKQLAGLPISSEDAKDVDPS